MGINGQVSVRELYRYLSSADFPVFRQTIDRCIAAGRALGVDLEQVLISDPDPSHVFTAAHGDMGLAAMQIGLVEMVRAAGLTWDGVVGHSAGETACGYADGCTTLEQTLQVTDVVSLQDRPRQVYLCA